MPSLTYQPLTHVQCLDVLRSAHVTRAAFTDGQRPYLVPMAFRLEAEGVTPLICLCMPDTGRKVEYLCRCDRLCLEFEQPDCAFVDVVLLEGPAVPDAWEQGSGLVLHVPGEEISGRRFFLPE